MPKIDQSKTLKNSHGGYAGRSIIERIQQQVDKLHTKLLTIENAPLAQTKAPSVNDSSESTVRYGKYQIFRGRYEGMCAALALLRSSSLEHEQEMSNERLGIE